MFLVVVVVLSACGAGDDDSYSAGQATSMTPVTVGPSTTTTVSPVEGVETFAVDAGHSEAPISYPQTPPVGGIHNPVWQRCGFYDQPVQNEKAVHSLEHGAIWITYRPDLPPADIDTLAALGRSRKDVLVSPWGDNGLRAPVVATAWGRQLRLELVGDPRLMEFVRIDANQGPEVNAPC